MRQAQGIEHVNSTTSALRLEVLHLEHIGIPADAFVTTIDANNLEELRISHSQVEPSVWQDLKKFKLQVLNDASYDHLGAPFLAFLQVQDNVECLTFARPRDVYRGDVNVFFTSEPHLIILVASQALQLGPGTSWYKPIPAIVPKELYPSFKKLFSALQGMCHLRYLRLPADMYDVSKAFM